MTNPEITFVEDTMETEETMNQNPVSNNKKTGAKKALATIGILALVAGTAFGVYKGVEVYNDFQETERARSIVEYYIDKDNIVSIPDEVLSSKAYDEEFCTGEKLVAGLQANNAEYCIIDGEYYTQNGDKIAVLTYEITRTETVSPIELEFNGAIVYIPPSGYELEDGVCTKTTVGTVTKIVPAQENGDYSNIKITNVTSYELIDAQVIQTKPYEEMYGSMLICDVRDNAQLSEEGYCEATFRLIKR